MCCALLGLHVFTDSDTASSFVGKGKTATLKLIQANDNLRAAMTNLGQSFTVTLQTLLGCVLFVCTLYGRPDKVDFNEVRYLLFCRSTLSAHQLPPTLDTLLKHVLRSNYQDAVWRRALTGQPEIPSPVGNGGADPGGWNRGPIPPPPPFSACIRVILRFRVPHCVCWLETELKRALLSAYDENPLISYTAS